MENIFNFDYASIKQSINSYNEELNKLSKTIKFVESKLQENEINEEFNFIFEEQSSKDDEQYFYFAKSLIWYFDENSKKWRLGYKEVFKSLMKTKTFLKPLIETALTERIEASKFLYKFLENFQWTKFDDGFDVYSINQNLNSEVLKTNP